MNTTNKRLGLNRDRAMIAGVCAGIADYFDMNTTLVRVLAVVAAFTWPPTVVAYLVAWFCMSDKRNGISELSSSVTNSKVGRHLRRVDYRKRLYKSRHNKRISGVCAGIGEYFEVNPLWIRLAAILSLFFGPFAILAYVVAAVIMDPEPYDGDDPERSSKGKYGRSYCSSAADYGLTKAKSYRRRRYASYGKADLEPEAPRFSNRQLKDTSETFARLEARLRNLEATITSKKFKLHSEFRRMST